MPKRKERSDEDILTFLERRGYNPLERACQDGDLPRIKSLLELFPQSINGLDGLKRTPFHMLCDNATQKDLVAIKYLANRFPHLPALKDRNRLTGLDYVVENEGPRDIVRFLVKKNPEQLENNNRYGTPLHRLCLHFHIGYEYFWRYLEILAMSEKSVMAKNRKGQTPFHLLVRNKACAHVGYLRALVKACPQVVREPDKRGRIPLHYAIDTLIEVQLNPIEDILDGSASHLEPWDTEYDEYVRDTQKRKVKRCVECIDLLLQEYPTGVAVIDKKGVSPLMLACEKDADLDLIHRLVSMDPVAAVRGSGFY